MEIFKYGSKLLRFDCHLHTKSDKEFKYTEEENEFLKKYVEELKKKSINVGIITNHNKFNKEEFKNLKKKALKEEIYLIPGVELSVKEGRNGIHVLIAFSEDWILDQNDNINSFLDNAFKGIPNRENENTRCNYDLTQTINELDSYNQEYFIIFAHVDNNSGLLNECGGGLIESLFKNESIREKSVALQKSNNNDNYNNFKQWSKMELARIEGSDPKKIEEIGKGENQTYIKIGDFSFNTVKNALIDHKNRVSKTEINKKSKHGYIKSLKIEGGKFDGKEFFFSNELNNIIGIRGSGKSAILEIIRDILELKSDVDSSYKDKLVTYYMGAGGKAILNVVDKYGRNYKIIKFFSDKITYFENEDGENENISINVLINNPLYFGQKDLSMRAPGYEMKLLDKLIGYKDITLNEEFDNLSISIESDFKELIGLVEIPEKIKELIIQKNDIGTQLKIFEEKGINEKLEKIQEFNNDNANIDNGIQKSKNLLEDLENAIEMSEIDFKDLKEYKSKYNEEIFKKLNTIINRIETELINFQQIKSNIAKEIVDMENAQKEFKNIKDGFLEEFEKIKREIKEDLNPDTYLTLSDKKNKIEESIVKLENKQKTINDIKNRIKSNLKERRELILKSCNIYETKIAQINESQDSIKISFIPNGNKEKFIEDLKVLIKGSGIRIDSISKIVDKFVDYIGILEDIYLNDSNKMKAILKESDIEKIKSILITKLEGISNYLPNNNVEIKYHDKLLENHSLGQRASAIILFILAQKENDIVIIDQPEDDLDNKVIYDELIKTIKKRKKDIQFVFSTHNANIPVLGDAEQIISLNDDGKTIVVKNNSIDNSAIQKEIVQIMEGGSEAFYRRNQIYNEWKINKNK